MGRKRAAGKLGIGAFAQQLLQPPQTTWSATSPLSVAPISHPSASAPGETLQPDGNQDTEDAAADEPPKKRPRVQAVGLLGTSHERIDVTGTVPHYRDITEVPQHLKKCKVPLSPLS
jgi:hypothetical protein